MTNKDTDHKKTIIQINDKLRNFEAICKKPQLSGDDFFQVMDYWQDFPLLLAEVIALPSGDWKSAVFTQLRHNGTLAADILSIRAEQLNLDSTGLVRAIHTCYVLIVLDRIATPTVNRGRTNKLEPLPENVLSMTTIAAYSNSRNTALTADQAETLKSGVAVFDRLNYIIQANNTPENHSAQKKDARHSTDFRSVHWYGTDYAFTPYQAACVRVLWEAMENGTPDVGAETILSKAECESQRLADVFRKSPAWQTIIRSGETKGSYQLAAPAHKKNQ